ncbi:MAG: hypothetical protein LBQ54_12640 [Planctomycetaceae bacterium]|nr:hypothetical protein [Planctomycetaceae bacterium]
MLLKPKEKRLERFFIRGRTERSEREASAIQRATLAPGLPGCGAACHAARCQQNDIAGSFGFLV